MMNERIKLPVQEWLGYDPEKGDIHGYTFEQMREFAELIVNQCADIAQQHNKSPVAAPLAIGYVIREHFGVEE
jgi:hypothetical protein